MESPVAGEKHGIVEFEAQPAAPAMEATPPALALGWGGAFALGWAAVTVLLSAYILKVNVAFASRVGARVRPSAKTGAAHGAPCLDKLLAECAAACCQ